MGGSAIIDQRASPGVHVGTHVRHADTANGATPEPERVLSRPPEVEDTRSRANNARSGSQAVEKTLLLAAIVICGITAVVGWRELGSLFGVFWLGDH